MCRPVFSGVAIHGRTRGGTVDAESAGACAALVLPYTFSIDPESGNDKPADQDRSAGDWWALQDLNL
jgi:hypothetical protein